MAWVERRSTRTPHWRVVWREADGRQYEKFPTAEQAEFYRQLVAANAERRVALPLPATTVAIPAQPVSTDTVTFADWARFWMNTYSGPRETTLVRYRSVIERDLIPVFGELDIAAINKQHDSGWIRQLQAAGAAPKTIRNKHGVLYQIMQAAVDFEPEPLRARNPITGKLPEIIFAEQRYLTQAEFARLEAAIHPQFRPFIRLLVGTGARYAEGAGLLVGRVRLLDSPAAIDVRQSWQKQADNTWALSPLKSKASRRSIRLSSAQVDDLIPLTAPHFAAADFVFRTINGKPLHHGYFSTAYWLPAVRSPDGPRVTADECDDEPVTVFQRLRQANHQLDQSWRRLRAGTQALVYWVALTALYDIMALIFPQPHDRWIGTLAGLTGLLITATVVFVSRLRNYRRVSQTKPPTA